MPTVNINAFQPIELTGKEAGQLLLDPLFVPESPLSTFSVMRNVKTNTKIWTLRSPGKILQANTGCGWNASGTLNLDPENMWVGRVKANIEQCTDEFFGTIWEEATGSEIDVENLDSTEAGRQLLNAMVAMIGYAVQDNMYRLAWMNDYDNEGSATTPAFYENTLHEVSDDTTNVRGILQLLDYYNSVGKTTKLSTTYSGSSLTATEAAEMLQALYVQSGIELKNVPNNRKVFKVTRSVYDAYQEHLEDTGTEQADTRLINGVEFLTYRGIPIESHDILDQDLALASGSGGFAITDPHVGILTTMGNFALGTDISGNDTTVEIWFDRQDEVWKYKAKFRMGVGIAAPKMAIYAK